MNKSNFSISFHLIKALSVFFAGCLFCVQASAQLAGVQSVEAKFEQFREQDLQEKLYVQTNKDFYVAGELLWFKIFDVNGATNEPFDLSKVAYVELLDRNNTPVLQTKVSLGGDGGGSVLLPFTLHSGNYMLRAYTSWMKNFSPEFYYHRAIAVVNTTLGQDFPERDSLANFRIRFFPEGGNLVAGLKSEVAFKMTNREGSVKHFRGVVVDENKDTVARFRPFKFGMGRFSFLPQSGHAYHAIVWTDKGERLVQELPRALDQGYVMHVETRPNNKVGIALQKNMPSEKTAGLIIHTREDIKAAEVLSFNGGRADFEIDKGKLGEGISQITVFNSKGQPICERLYFNPVKKKLSFELKTNKQQYTTREEVQLDLSIKDNPDSVDWAVSVYKLDSLQHKDRENILNYLWLSSELKGRIENPDYYFGEGDSVRRAADNLMMTQGWRRFDWEKVLDQKPVIHEYIPEMKGPVISGLISRPQKRTVASGTKAWLSIPGKKVRLYVSQSNREGAVFFNMKDFYGPHQVVVRIDPTTKDSTDQIKILSPFSEKYSRYSLPAFPITKALKGPLEAHNLWMQVEQAYHHEERNRWAPGHSDTLPFYGRPYQSYLLDNYTRYVTMEEVLREYVEEVAVRRSRKQYHFMVVNALSDLDQSLSHMLFRDDPLVLFDGVPVFDINKVMAFDPLKVQKIDVVAGRYFYGPLVADGIVSFTTYKGDLRDYPLNPHAVVVDYEGLQRGRIFYSPDYDAREYISSRIPDFRNALYWSSDVKTNDNGNTSCSFFTSDLPGKYIVVVNGITADGYAGSVTKTFEVKQAGRESGSNPLLTKGSVSKAIFCSSPAWETRQAGFSEL